MKIRQYLENNRGYACVKLHLGGKKELLLGLSEGLVDEPFYLARDKKNGNIEGPFAFGFANDKIQEIMDYDLKGNGTIIENIPERRLVE
ncbi:hypothetical protein ABFV99_14280 [Cytobacillus horneckiae]|uniref:hypothetical protein n=1 Tax=Cytobacillus horneckiae TaxID=549687 RepID=UPI0034D00BE3